MKGDKHALRLGYYVTKQPDTAQLRQRLSRSEARELEKQFFKGNAPWNTSETNKIRGRFGVENLTKELSEQLSRLIEEM